MAKDIRFDPAVQPLFELDVGAGFRPVEEWRLVAGVSVGQIGEAATLSGILYRSVALRSAWASVSWVPGRSGVEIGVRGVLASYLLGLRLFFYPEVTVAPVFVLQLTESVALLVATPMGWQLREDLAWSATAGIQVSLEAGVSRAAAGRR